MTRPSCAGSSRRPATTKALIGDEDLALALAAGLKKLRPELDIYLLSDRHVERIAGDPRANGIRRVLYSVEELLELHLSILEGVADRLRDALLRQPQEIRAAAHRHLPRAADRARQVGVQVRLDPRHGRVLRASTSSSRRAAPRPAASTACWSRPATSRKRRTWRRAPSAPTTCSSSPTAPRPRTRWCVQALVAPGDIVHRRPQLPQVAPLRAGAGRRPAALRRSLPADGILDVWRGAAGRDQEGAARPQGRRAARPGARCST